MKSVRWNWDLRPDEPVYDGKWDLTRWNGFPNIWVTLETHLRVIADMEADPLTLPETVDEFRNMAQEFNGMIYYGWGYTPRIVG